MTFFTIPCEAGLVAQLLYGRQFVLAFAVHIPLWAFILTVRNSHDGIRVRWYLCIELRLVQ